MPTFGKLDEYNETKDWHHYTEHVNYFFDANEITNPDKKTAIVQRFKFNTHSQQPGETIATFLAELRHLTKLCEFGPTLDTELITSRTEINPEAGH